MTENDLLKWFDELAAACGQRAAAAGQGGRTATADAELLAEMQSALYAAFPPAHALRVRWEEARARALKGRHADRPAPDVWIFQEFEGTFASAHKQVKDGRLRSLAEGIRSETVGECLDVAETLLAAKHVVAAMVVAGGALEVHLRHLCNRFGVTWNGEGSIAKYNDGLAQARNTGVQTIAPSDTKAVTAWGGRRNDAAHDPVNFTGTVEEVRLIIEGIRQFVARTQ